jgi:hypothetical protein
MATHPSVVVGVANELVESLPFIFDVRLEVLLVIAAGGAMDDEVEFAVEDVVAIIIVDSIPLQ